MMHLISLNELVLPKFIFLTLLGKNVKILRVAPIFPKMLGLLQRAADKAIAANRAQYAVELAPELKLYWQFDRRFYFQEVFKKYEPWQNRYYGFERHEVENDPVYGYGFKQMTCSYTFWKVIEIYLLDSICRNPEIGDFKVHGVMEDTIAMGRDHFGDGFAPHVSSLVYPRIVLNAGLVMLAMLFTLSWVVRRIRPSINVEKVDVAFDRMGDNREYELFKEISPAGKFVLIERFPHGNPASLPDCLDYKSCLRTDGLFTPLGAVQAVIGSTTDIFRLAFRHKKTPPRLFYEMLTLPYKRLLVRGLINRFRPGIFIGRDEYNVDHVMRRAELNAHGVKSIGLSNALFPCFSKLAPNVRYVSFDTYYVYAAPLFVQYHNTWANDMRVRTMGGYSVPREKLISQAGPDGENILFTIRVAWDRPEMVSMVRAVAKAFPERKVVLQFKTGFVSEDDTERLVRECGEGLDNFEHTTDDVYALLPRAKYHISDNSTFLVEAIRFGMMTFLADLIDQEFNCYRLFPGMTAKTAEELVGKLKAIESGEATYPRQEYFELLGYKQGEVGFDLLREEIGISSPRASV